MTRSLKGAFGEY